MPDEKKIVTMGEMLGQVLQDAMNQGKHDLVLDFIRKQQERPGIRTTEFWLAIAVNAAGVAMGMWKGHEAIGAVMILVASGVYTLSRAFVKK